MHSFLLLGAAMVGLAVSGCTSVEQQTFLKDIQGCDRHYEGALGAGVNASFKIDCKAIVVIPTSPPAP